jgi:DNA phosphorothioation-dependent restriction protein DptH
MSTYKDNAAEPATSSNSSKRSRAQPQVTGVRVWLGSDVQTHEPRYWVPTPEGGTTNPHLLIIGESGSGKTYATQCICAELAQRNVPTLVFDFGQGFSTTSTPPEFSRYAGPDEISVARDGININPLQIFPSDIYGPVNVAQRVADTFARIYPMIGVQQHAVLRDAILRAFADVGINSHNANSWKRQPPRFSDLKATLDSIATDKNDPARKLAAAVASHISTVFIFNTFRATGLEVDWSTMLLPGPHTYIFQLKGLENLLERIVTELLLWNLIGYVESLGPGSLRCIVVLDEAHRMSFATDAPVEKLLREGRKFGLGLVLASQQPEDFSSVAFTNTASKLIFNVTDERGAIARQIARRSGSGATFSSLSRRIGTMPRGQACFVSGELITIVEIADFGQRALQWRSPG